MYVKYDGNYKMYFSQNNGRWASFYGNGQCSRSWTGLSHSLFFDYGKKMVAGKARRLNYWVGFVAFLESTLEEIGGDFQVCINTL